MAAEVPAPERRTAARGLAFFFKKWPCLFLLKPVWFDLFSSELISLVLFVLVERWCFEEFCFLNGSVPGVVFF